MDRIRKLNEKEDWSEEIKYLLEKFDATYLELAWAIGCTSNSIAKYANGGEPANGIKMKIDNFYKDVTGGRITKIVREQPRQLYPNKPKETGDLIRGARKQKELTQDKLSELIGVSLGTLNRWEAGKGYPRIGTFKKIESTLEVDSNILMGLGKGWHTEIR